MGSQRANTGAGRFGVRARTAAPGRCGEVGQNRSRPPEM